MRKYAVVTLLILALMVAGVAFAQPPDGDPSGGNGRNGGNGCRGIDTAEDHGANNRGNAGDAFDLVNRILGCDD